MVTPSVETSEQTEVAPFILERVGDADRPLKGMPTDIDLSHLPGESGFLAAARNTIK